jgi:hypothetical protein
MLATHRARAVRTYRSGRLAGHQPGSSAAGQDCGAHSPNS